MSTRITVMKTVGHRDCIGWLAEIVSVDVGRHDHRSSLPATTVPFLLASLLFPLAL